MKVLDTMQTFPCVKVLLILIFAVSLTGISCTESEVQESEVIGEPCFTKASLDTVPWIKDQLAFFQMPRQGPLRVAVYRYRGQDFLAFENPTLSSPMSYIFNCEGKTIGEVDIRYSEFYGANKLTAVLLDTKY